LAHTLVSERVGNCFARLVGHAWCVFATDVELKKVRPGSGSAFDFLAPLLQPRDIASRDIVRNIDITGG